MSVALTASLTALFAVLVFVVGQFIQRFFLEPIQDQRKIIGEIAFALVFYENIMDVSERRKSSIPLLELEDPIVVAKNIRRLASQLRATLYTIPFYGLFSLLRLVPKASALSSASTSLVGWSNSIHSGNPDVHKKEIVEQLKLKK